MREQPRERPPEPERAGRMSAAEAAEEQARADEVEEVRAEAESLLESGTAADDLSAHELAVVAVRWRKARRGR